MTQNSDSDLVSEAQAGRELIERAIIGLLATKSHGLTNAQIARELLLETGLRTGQKNYLTWSILKELVARGMIGTIPKLKGSGVLFVPVSQANQR